MTLALTHTIIMTSVFETWDLIYVGELKTPMIDIWVKQPISKKSSLSLLPLSCLCMIKSEGRVFMFSDQSSDAVHSLLPKYDKTIPPHDHLPVYVAISVCYQIYKYEWELTVFRTRGPHKNVVVQDVTHKLKPIVRKKKIHVMKKKTALFITARACISHRFTKDIAQLVMRHLYEN